MLEGFGGLLMGMRYPAPIEKCKKCGSLEFDCGYGDRGSYAVCLGCLHMYLLLEEDEEEL